MLKQCQFTKKKFSSRVKSLVKFLIKSKQDRTFLQFDKNPQQQKWDNVFSYLWGLILPLFFRKNCSDF